MSHIRVKTEYQVENHVGEIEKRTLYAHHNNFCDLVQFFDEDGDFIFSVQDCVENNLLDSINRLYYPFNAKNELDENIQYMNSEDVEKCNLK